MITEALNLLKQEYENNRDNLKDGTIYAVWYYEKWRHSLQVFGAGNYLVRHIKWLRNKPSEYIETVRSAVLLHDIARFKEINALINKNKKLDHGVEGANILQKTAMFNDIRIWLPIKHHGHLIEALYDDEEYQNLPEDLREEVKLICFIVRDADKIANLRMIAYEKNMRPLFLSYGSGDKQKDYHVTEFAKKDVFSGRTVRRSSECTIADRMLGYLSWFNDINYCYSVEFCQKLNVIEKLKEHFTQVCDDAEFVKKYFAYFDECLRKRDFLA